MSDTIITVENLSKSYLVGHRLGQRERYTALRDVISREARNFTRKAVDLVRGRQIVQGDEVEEFWALKDVSFEVKQGEVLGIIGRNGAGKSTLLKVISRITEPTRGRIKIKGRVASLLEVGTGFHPELTGRENIFLNGAILGMKRAEIRQKFDEIVAFAEVERFLDTPVKHYSSGMYVRLAFAVAAHLEPEILIIDEVLAVGDAEFQKKCLGKMQDVSQQHGRTVIFVSHNMAAIQHLCSRAILLQGGHIIADGPAAKVIGEYLSDGSSGSQVDLTKWADRKSSGEALITKLELGDGVGGNSIRLGADLNIKIYARFDTPVIDASFGINIHDALGTPLLDVRSTHDGLRLGRLLGNVVVEVRIPELGLYPGRYFLSPYIRHEAIERNIDFARRCATLDVWPTPGRHGDLKLDSNWGTYFVTSHWKSGTVL